jgi:hypothetical protein
MGAGICIQIRVYKPIYMYASIYTCIYLWEEFLGLPCVWTICTGNPINSDC